LSYSIEDLSSAEGQMLDVMQAKLTVQEVIEDSETKRCVSAIIWTKVCFIKITEGTLQERVSKTFHYLMNEFSKDYSSVNATLPSFHFYEP